MSLGSDPTDLGRWNWAQLKGQTSSAHIIVVCQCVESRTTVGTVFSQRERYLQKCNSTMCPRKHFIQDLINFIRGVLEDHNKVILAADVNEHVTTGNLLIELKRLGLVEAHVRKFNSPGPASHVTGSDPINGVWVSDDAVPAEVSILPYKFGAGDHRMILVDFDLDQIIERRVNICAPSMRRLICENKKSVKNCDDLASQLLTSNNVQQ